LFDTTNGGCVSWRALLHALIERGFDCRAVTDCDFTERYPNPEDLRARLHAVPGLRMRSFRFKGTACMEVCDGQLLHMVLMSDEEERHKRASLFLEHVDSELAAFRPDVVLAYFRDPLSARVVELARQRGIPVMLFVLTASYLPARATARAADMLVAPSAAAAEAIGDRLGTVVRVAPPVMVPERHLADRRGAKYITFINPVLEKGVTLVWRLAEQARAHLPEARFLVAESRGTRETMVELGIDLVRCPNLEFMPNQWDMRKVYARTRILLFPSFWPEAFGMCVVEAQANGIPVLAADVGGIPEAANGGATLLSVPRRCLERFELVPSGREVASWLRRLRTLLRAPGELAIAQRRARRAAARYLPSKTVPITIRLIDELLSAS
jgi:glycosyltransferase involved in cell wall biosynthesis